MFLTAFRERERERGKRETLMWERSMYWLPPIHAQTGDWTCNLGMSPDGESKPQPFRYEMMLHPAEPHWPGLFCDFFPFVPIPHTLS